MEVIKLENMGYYRDDMTIPGDIFLLQVSNYFTLPFFQDIYCRSPPYCNHKGIKNTSIFVIDRKHYKTLLMLVNFIFLLTNQALFPLFANNKMRRISGMMICIVDGIF